MSLHSLIPKLGVGLTKQAPLILTVVGSAGVIATAVMTAKATPKAIKLIEQKKLDIVEEVSKEGEPVTIDDVDLRVKEYVSVLWRLYVPSALMGVTTILAISGAHTINARRGAALLSAYSLTDRAFSEYKDTVKEKIGESKEQEVRDTVAKKHMEINPPPEKGAMVIRDKKTLCYDTLTGRYFESDIETIRAAQNDINEIVLSDMYASQNEFYDRIGIPATDIGEDLGWDIDHKMRLIFSAMLTPDQQPCLSVQYQDLPKPKYYKIG